MRAADLDPTDWDDYRAFLDKRGLPPSRFQVEGSAADPTEGELGVSRRTVTVRHAPSGLARTYGFRTWVADFKADVAADVFSI